MGAPIKWHDDWILENHTKHRTYKALAEAYEAEFGERVNPDSLNEHARLYLGIGKSRKTGWNDEWIKMNYLNYASYAVMAEAHNELFGTNGNGKSLKHYAKYKLGLSKPHPVERYTEEQIAWLMENYPRMGCRKVAEAFNERFGCNKTVSAMKNFGVVHGIQVEHEVASINKVEQHISPVGAIRREGNRTVIKTEEGWEQVGRAVVKAAGLEIPKGYNVIHLDGDTSHYDISNLAVVPVKYCGLLMAHGLRSEDARITKAGVAWCELYESLIKAGVKIRKGGLMP